MSERQERSQHPPQVGQPPASPAPLSGYRRRKLELGELISAAMKLAAERRREPAQHSPRQLSGRELLARLADDRFQLAVVGQFSRGKSTLMNAIMGAPYLPTGALPMTSVLTTVRYGSRPRVIVRRRGSDRFPIETTLRELPRFVTQASGERDQLQVVSAEVELPAEILRLGFHFVDTPGIGSAIAANTATTKSFLPDADAVIFVTSFDAPLSEAELRFLADVRQHVEKVFLVINKLDLVTPHESKQVDRFIRQQLNELTDGAERGLFAVSARDALEAKRSRNTQQLLDSGLPDLQRSLVRFLSEEKAHTFLLTVAAHAQRLLAQLRFDLALGRAGLTERDGGAADPRTVFHAQAEQVFAQQHEVVDRLLERTAAELPQALEPHSAAWTEQLRKLAGAELEALVPSDGSRIRDWALEARSRLEEALSPRLAPWVDGRIAQTRSLLVELAAADLATLHSLEYSVQRLAADSFHVPLDAGPPQGWSPNELPELTIQAPALSIPLELPSWSPRIRASRRSDHARLMEAMDAGIAAFIDDLRTVLLRAARHWVKSVGAATDRRTRDSVDHVQGNARQPPSREQLAELEGLEARLATLRAEVAAWEATDRGAADATVTLEPVPAAEQVARCPICEQVAGVPFDYMARAQWELFRHEDQREQHARSGGFCPLHTWQYAEIASDAGVALAYTPVARAAAEALACDGVNGDPRRPAAVSAALARLLPGPDRCPACAALAEAEHGAIRQLLTTLTAQPETDETPPVCVRHLAAIIAVDPGAAVVTRLAERLAQTLRRSAQDMQTYSLKRESLRAHLLTEEERAAFMQVLRLLSGRRELARPFREQDEIG